MSGVIWGCPRITAEGDDEMVHAIDMALFTLFTTPLIDRFLDQPALAEPMRPRQHDATRAEVRHGAKR